MRTVYILRCNDDSLYAGITTDIHRRLKEHNNMSCGAKYTRSRRPVCLVRKQIVVNRSLASKVELKIKRMTKFQKEKLVVSQEEIFL